jgi:plastocyanin
MNRLENLFKTKLSRRSLIGSTGLGAFAAALVAACGGGGGSGDGGGGSSDGGSSDEAADITVIIVGTSPFHFEPDAIEFPSGVEQLLEFRNESELPHSFRIDGVVDTGVIKNPGSDAKSSASTKRVRFTAKEPGEKIFYCTAHGPQSESGKVTIT